MWDGGWEGDFVEGVNELATAGELVLRVWGAGWCLFRKGGCW